MSRSGHSDYKTTRIYIDLAGVRFRGEADRLENRLWGSNGTNSRYQEADLLAAEEATEAANPLVESGGGGI
jgi:hypothetical protein